jgi:hypothetical protein
MFRGRVLLLSILTTGCLGGPEPLGAEFRGIYRVDSFTENNGSCEIEGSSVLSQSTDHLVAFTGKVKDGNWVWLSTCADVDRCRAYYRAYTRGEGTGLGNFFFMQFDQDLGDHLEGSAVRTGVSGGTQCDDGQLITAVLSGSPGATVRIEARTVIVAHPTDANGMCTAIDTRRAAEGKPCARLRVLTATRIESL